MLKNTGILFVAISLYGLSFSQAFAEGLDARTNSKVMRVKRHQALDQYEKAQDQPSQVGSPKSATANDPCNAGVNIGNVMVDGNNRFGPRENTVVVTGDVIFAPSRNCR